MSICLLKRTATYLEFLLTIYRTIVSLCTQDSEKHRREEMIPYAKFNQPRNTDRMAFFTNLPSDVQTFLCTGITDLRKSIDGLSGIVENEYGLNPYSKSMYFFCGNNANMLKALFYDGFAFVMLIIHSVENEFQWPEEKGEMWKVSRMTLIEMLEGKKIEKEAALRIFPQIVEH